MPSCLQWNCQLLPESIPDQVQETLEHLLEASFFFPRWIVDVLLQFDIFVTFLVTRVTSRLWAPLWECSSLKTEMISNVLVISRSLEVCYMSMTNIVPYSMDFVIRTLYILHENNFLKAYEKLHKKKK